MTATARNVETMQPTAGDMAPDFVLPIDGGTTITLSQFKGDKNVVLYFYPKDDTPGCTTEAKDFRDTAEAFAAADTVILGVSKDDVASHDGFKAKYCLPFTLASDTNGDVCERYGVWGEKNMYGKKYMGITRATFLIGKDGKIAKVWPKVKVDGHAQEVLTAAQALA
jgi:peroxiredoxin Q/BCP